MVEGVRSGITVRVGVAIYIDGQLKFGGNLYMHVLTWKHYHSSVTNMALQQMVESTWF